MHRFRLNGVTADLSENRIERNGRSVRITPKAGAVLRVLIEQQHRAVTREELFETVWPGLYPTDDVLTQAIGELRRALGDTAQDRDFIRTVPKVGYRLVAAVSEAPPGHTRNPFRDTRVMGLVAVLALVTLPIGILLLVGHFSLESRPYHQVLEAEMQPVTFEPGRKTRPTPSPDGEYMVYTPVGARGEHGPQIVRPVGSNDRSPLPHEPGALDTAAAWSPDGDYIAFQRHFPGNCEVHLHNRENGITRKLADGCPGSLVTLMDWFPDGQSLLVSHYDAEAGIRLHRLGLDGSRKPLDYDFTAGDIDAEARISPDGGRIAIRRGNWPDNSLHIIDAEKGNTRTLTPHELPLKGFDWTPDGSGIVFSSPHEGRPTLWLMDAEDGAVTGLGISGALWPRFSADGSVLLFERWEGRTGLAAVDLDPGEEAHPEDGEQLFASRFNEHTPRVSPDGRKLAFRSDRTGEEQIWLGNLRTGQSRQLTKHDTGLISSLAWHPSGEQIAYVLTDYDKRTLFHQPISDGEPRRISERNENIRDAAFSPEGDSLYFSSDRTGTWQLHQYKLQEGQRSLLGGKDIDRVQASRDDGNLVVTRRDREGLWTLELENGNMEPTSISLTTAKSHAWDAHPDAIWYIQVKDEGDNPRLMRQPGLQATATQVREYQVGHGQFNATTISVDRDGNHAYITETLSEESIVYMIADPTTLLP